MTASAQDPNTQTVEKNAIRTVNNMRIFAVIPFVKLSVWVLQHTSLFTV